jgi:hypothetical protein
MKTKLFLWVVLFLAVLPIVFSFDCTLVGDTSECNNIQHSSLTEAEKEELYSSLLYPENSILNYQLIQNYNNEVVMTSHPTETEVYNSKYIKNAWLSFSSILPSVYDTKLLVPSTVQVLSHYNYQTVLPSNYYAYDHPEESNGDCQREYSAQSSSSITYYLNGIYKGDSLIYIDSSGTLKSELKINLEVKTKHYQWRKYWRWYLCRYSYTSSDSDSLVITESKDVTLYLDQPTIKIFNTNKINFSADNYNNLEIKFTNSSYSEQLQTYYVVFEKQPYHVAYLKTRNTNLNQQNNLYLSDGYLYVNNIDECTVKASNHFYSVEKDGNIISQQQEVLPLKIEKKSLDLSVLYVIGIFLLLLYLIFKILKSQFKKIIIPLMFLLLIPTVMAETEECGITNIASCLPNVIYDFILSVINAPLAPLLVATEKLLTTNVSISLFYHIWSIIRYMLSFFYIFLILYAGYIFLTANADPIRRAHAKELLKNLVIIMVLVQGSYYIYGLLINVSSNISASIISFVDPYFFLLTADNLANIGLEFLFAFMYMITLFATVLFLVFRYIMVAIGVIFFPIGIFCYFIPPLKSYGKFMVNLVMVMIFITFFDLLIILVCSEIVNVAIFENMKILVMIICFQIINYTLWLAMKFAIKRSTSGSLKDDLNQAVKYIALLA